MSTFAAVLIVCAVDVKQCITAVGPAEFISRETCVAVREQLLESPLTQIYINELIVDKEWGTSVIKSSVECLDKEEYEELKASDTIMKKKTNG